ncbi:MAG: TRAP transporter small permease [Lachnospiraceae bacterium]
MKTISWLDKHLEEVILVALLFVMMMIMGVQVLARYALGNSLSWSEEITRFCFIWTGFLSISYCIRHEKSIKIDQFVDWFSGGNQGLIRNIFSIAAYVIEFALFMYLLPFAYHYVQESFISQSTSPAVGIPMWMVQSITLVAFVLCEIRLAQKFVLQIMKIRNAKNERGGKR